MPIIESSLWRGVFPFLWVGGTGTGIRLYIGEGYKLDSGFLNFPKKTPPKTFSDSLKADSLKLVDNNTQESVLKNILQQRMYPHYQKKFSYSKDQIFKGSKAFELDGKSYETNSNKKLFIFNENKTEDANNLKSECIKELNKTDPSKDKNKDAQYYRLKEWCTEPTIKAVLGRHKFKILNTDNKTNDAKWKEVIGGGWFSDANKSKQSFIDSSKLGSFSGIISRDNVQDTHINILKNKCKEVLNKPFERKAFPASQTFISELKTKDKSKFTKPDEFQDAALFCTEPKSAKDYVEISMRGETRTSLPTQERDWKDDFCLLESKKIDDYKNTKTNEYFEGKGFWCAVRILYHRNKSTK